MLFMMGNCITAEQAMQIDQPMLKLRTLYQEIKLAYVNAILMDHGIVEV
jgi:hypothetical protein